MERMTRVFQRRDTLLLWLLFIITCKDSKGNNVVDYAKKLREDIFANKHSIETHVRPLKEAVFVEMQVFLRHVKELDIKNETLAAQLLLTMSWEDQRLSWDPEKYGGVTDIHVTNKFIWTPDIMHYNGVRDEADIYKNTLLRVFAKGKVVWVNPLTLVSTCPVDLKRYPFDKHHCVIRLGSWTQHAYMISLSLKNTTVLLTEREHHDDTDSEKDNDTDEKNVKKHQVETYLDNSIWEILNTSAHVEEKRYECCREPYLSVAVYLTLQRKSPQYLVTLILPICMSMIVMIAIFLFPPTSGEKIGLGCFAILYLLLLDLYTYWTIPSNGSSVPNIVILIGASLMMANLSVIMSVILLSLSSLSHQRGVPLLASLLGKITCLDLQNNQGSFDTASSSMVGELSNTISEKRHEWAILAKAIDRIFLGTYIIITIILLGSLLS